MPELSAETQRDLLLDEIPALVRKYGNVAATAAAEWYEEARAQAIGGSYDALTVDSYPEAAIQDTVRWQAGKLFTGDAADMASFLTGSLQRWVQYSGRETIARNVSSDSSNPRYARVPSGARTCAFCEMLASRGFVYRSEKSATLTKLYSEYHDHCHCTAVASWDADESHIEGYDPDAMYDRYMTARDSIESENPGATPSTADILSKMRELYPDSYTG